MRTRRMATSSGLLNASFEPLRSGIRWAVAGAVGRGSRTHPSLTTSGVLGCLDRFVHGKNQGVDEGDERRSE